MTVTSAQVQTLLTDILGETASSTTDASDLSEYLALSNNLGSATVTTLAAQIGNDPEASIAQQVYRLYEAVLGRAPDAAGLQNWVATAEAGLTAAQIHAGASSVSQTTWNTIINGFTASSEFQAKYAGIGGAALVDLLYANILGRTPDATGLATWTGILGNATAGAGATPAAVITVVNGIVNSAEFITDTQAANTAATVAAAVADTGTGPTYTEPASITAAHSTSYTLTTGVDTLAATTTGANNFVGTLDNALSGGVPTAATTATFGGADSVTGLGSTNTLTLTDSSSTGVDLLPVGATISDIQAIVLKTAGNAGNTVNGGGGQPTNAHTFDVSGVSGLTSVSITSSGTWGDNVKAAATTSITDTNVGGSAITTQGGLNVTASSSGAINIGNTGASDAAGAIIVTESGTGAVTVDGGTTVTVTGKNAALSIDQNAASSGAIAVTSTGSTSVASAILVGTGANAPTSTVTVTETGSLAAAATSGAITIVGGTVDTVTSNIAPSAAAIAAQALTTVGGTLTGGNISVTGSTSTTSVSVTQTAAVAPVNSGVPAANAGAAGTATAGSPGVDAVAATAASPAVALVPGTFGVVDGTVSITDANATITTVSLTNYGNTTFSGNALSTLSLSGTGGTVGITDAAATNTTLTLNLNSVSAAPTLTTGITDNSSKIKVINAVTTGTASTITSINAAALTTINVSGTGGLTLSSGLNGADVALTTVAVTGSASFSDGGAYSSGIASLAGLTTVTTTSSGAFTAALNDTTTTFTGSTGADTITISGAADATKTITAGSASTNELIVSTTGAGSAYSLTAATAAKVTGFQTLGLALAGTGANTVDASVIDAAASKLDIISSPGSALTVSKLATGATISIDATTNQNIVVGFADAHGASDSTTVTLAKGVVTVSSLTLQDANAVGVATVAITQTKATVDQTITALNDTDLSNLTVSGGDELSVTGLVETTNATQLSIVDNDAGAVTGTALDIGTLTGPTIGSISFAGTGATTIGAFSPNATVTTLSLANTGAQTATITTLTDTSLGTINFSGSAAIKIGTIATDAVASLTLANSGTATDTITTLVDTGLASLTVTGSVKLGSDDGNAANAIQMGAAGITTGETVTAGTDNAHINIKTLGLTAAAATDTITVGNGNDQITDVTTAGFVNITVGTGSNLIDVHTGAATTYKASITLGAHTSAGPDEILVAHNTTTATPAATTVITGAVAGDILGFTDTPTSVVTLSATNQTNVTNAASVAAAVNLVDALAGTIAHSATVFTYGGNTYVLESVGAGTGTIATGDSLVELVGVHTLSATIGGTGHLTLAS